MLPQQFSLAFIHDTCWSIVGSLQDTGFSIPSFFEHLFLCSSDTGFSISLFFEHLFHGSCNIAHTYTDTRTCFNSASCLSSSWLRSYSILGMIIYCCFAILIMPDCSRCPFIQMFMSFSHDSSLSGVLSYFLAHRVSSSFCTFSILQLQVAFSKNPRSWLLR